jgi:hypothetical protein
MQPTPFNVLHWVPASGKALAGCARFLRMLRIHRFVVISSQIVVTILRLSTTNQRGKKIHYACGAFAIAYPAIVKQPIFSGAQDNALSR